MKIPFNWLKDYVGIGSMSPKEVAERLTIVGLEVVLIEEIAGDSVFDIEVTPNRPDCLSVLGIAREVSAALNKKLKAPRVKAIKGKVSQKPSITIKDNKLCPRYTGRIIRGIKVGASPKWLAERIRAMGMRPINNIADITNYCLFEVGQPTHAFDYDKLKGGIIARRARKGEEMVTIDGKKRTLEADMLVIADEEKSIAIGGVMGSKDTEVTEATRNILFESAYFDPVSIRRTSRGLGLISESSYRFERSVDKGGVRTTSDRACGLIMELCGGEAGPLNSVGEKDPKDVKVYLRPERLREMLGLDISDSAVKKILKSLELKVEASGKKTMVISVPSFRQDLKAEVDLIEEVVRIYGYDKLPSTMPTLVGHPRRIEPARQLRNMVRETLASLGADEVITYSLISKDELKSAEFSVGDDVIVLKNPLSIEQEAMRTTLVPGVLHTVSWNLNRGTKDLRIFELGKVYFAQTRGFREEDSLSIAFAGDKPYSWRGKDEPLLFGMKGMLETLFEKLGVTGVLFKPEDLPPFFTAVGGAIEVSKKRIGFLGKVKKSVLNKFDIKTDVILCELSLEKLFAHVKFEKRFHEMPKFPSAKRDISIIVGKNASYQKITSVIEETGGDLVASIELFDQYFGIQIPKGSRGLSYSIEYRAGNRTLTDEEVNNLHGRVCDALVQQLDAKIR
ncbi:MAG: phenylalanine--tRNA ligase subunit beta [Candidatus Omnitrophica bacterium]|nr:phenylalanine--tRNA ligase subunit beta [Candidatus Omnitrophota bacterium]